MAKHIGIVAVSPEGSALCYQEISRELTRLLGDTGHPTITLHNEPFGDYIQAVRREDWHSVGALLAKSAKIVAAAGAEFCITPDNLMQHGVHLAEGDSPVPWLMMTELVAKAVAQDGRKTVGLIGTRLVMTGSTYQTHLGLKGVHVLVPEGKDADDIDAIIFQELIYGTVKPQSRERVVQVVQSLAERGCDGVIVGSTELPLLVTAGTVSLPLYDSTALLAHGAVARSIGLT